MSESTSTWSSVLTARLRQRLEGRAFVLTSTTAGVTGNRDALEALGAEVLGAVSAVGTATMSPQLLVPLDDPPLGIVEHGRAWYASLARPVPVLRAFVDRIDPDARAVVMGAPWADACPDGLLGRPLYGARHPSFLGLEDKTTIDAVFDAIGVPRPPGVVCTPEDAVARARDLDDGAGTIWAADGITAGAFALHRVRDDQEAAVATRALAGCARVRVSRWVRGTPCSVHAMVHAGGVFVTGPMRILCLQDAVGQVVFCGVTSCLGSRVGPLESDLRELARVAGEGLRRQLGYRGMFGIDGIVGDDGFVATEINPRTSLGSDVAVGGLDGLALSVLNAAVLQHPELAVPDGIQQAVIDHLHAAPRQKLLTNSPLAGPTGELETHGVHVKVRQVARQRLVMASPADPLTPSRVAAVLGELDAVFALGIGALRPLDGDPPDES